MPLTPYQREIRRGEWDGLIDYLVFPGEENDRGFTEFRLYPIPTYLARELMARAVRLVRGEDA